MRKPENIKEMLKASTINRYLEDIISQAKTKIRKAKIEQDKKACILDCIPAVKHYAVAPDVGSSALDEVLEFLEGICDESLGDMQLIHNMRVLFQHYESFDAHEGEASECKKKLQNIEIKYKPHSAHSQSEISHFLDGMGSNY